MDGLRSMLHAHPETTNPLPIAAKKERCGPLTCGAWGLRWHEGRSHGRIPKTCHAASVKQSKDIIMLLATIVTYQYVPILCMQDMHKMC